MDSLTPAVPSSALVSIFSVLFSSSAGGGNQRRRKPRKSSRQAGQFHVKVTRGNRVVMFGRIRELALYRAEVLRAHGFVVALPESKAEAAAAIRGGGFDAVVLSYTLSNDTVQELTELLRQHWPECRLITISDTRYPDPKISRDANVLADDGPRALLDALHSTLTG